MTLSTNRDYFSKQHKQVNLRNSDVWCFLLGTDWVHKYYFDELWIQTFNLRSAYVFSHFTPQYLVSPLFMVVQKPS
jgi:hypothetical protein